MYRNTEYMCIQKLDISNMRQQKQKLTRREFQSCEVNQDERERERKWEGGARSRVASCELQRMLGRLRSAEGKSERVRGSEGGRDKVKGQDGIKRDGAARESAHACTSCSNEIS